MTIPIDKALLDAIESCVKCAYNWVDEYSGPEEAAQDEEIQLVQAWLAEQRTGLTR